MFNYLTSWFTSNLVTSPSKDTSRIRVDVGQTGFFEGREFRINQPITIPSTDTDGTIIKFFSPIDFTLQLQTFIVDQDSLLFEAYRGDQGVDSGTWNTNQYKLPNNGMASAPDYTPLIQVFDNTGVGSTGAFTPNANEIPKEVVRVVAANATAQRTSVGGSATKERGLPAGTYYLKFTNYLGAGQTEAIYNLIYEERP